MKFRIIGLTIIILSMIYCFIETAHYGWNLNAQTKEENLADLISLFLYSVGMSIMFMGFKKAK